MFLHEVKAGGSFLKGTQSRGLVIIDHMVPSVQQRLEMKQHFSSAWPSFSADLFCTNVSLQPFHYICFHFLTGWL